MMLIKQKQGNWMFLLSKRFVIAEKIVPAVNNKLGRTLRLQEATGSQTGLFKYFYSQVGNSCTRQRVL